MFISRLICVAVTGMGKENAYRILAVKHPRNRTRGLPANCWENIVTVTVYGVVSYKASHTWDHRLYFPSEGIRAWWRNG
jgi:hypothetical protein